jgi:hypothetical protein
MAALPPLVVTALIAVGTAAAGAAVSSALAPKPKAIVNPAAARGLTSRSGALDRADMNDILSRRQGTAANKRVGFGAGEASTGPKRSLLGRV